MSSLRLMELLSPLFKEIGGLDLAKPGEAARMLNERFPIDAPAIAAIGALFRQGVDEGWLCDREAGAARFSRVAKSEAANLSFSVDAVRLSGPGPWHRHTGGEIDLCFAHQPGARFDGHPQGWVVFPPGSEHVPTAGGGTMDILYFLPGGKIEWKR